MQRRKRRYRSLVESIAPFYIVSLALYAWLVAVEYQLNHMNSLGLSREQILSTRYPLLNSWSVRGHDIQYGFIYAYLHWTLNRTVNWSVTEYSTDKADTSHQPCVRVYLSSVTFFLIIDIAFVSTRMVHPNPVQQVLQNVGEVMLEAITKRQQRLDQPWNQITESRIRGERIHEDDPQSQEERQRLENEYQRLQEKYQWLRAKNQRLREECHEYLKKWDKIHPIKKWTNIPVNF